MKRDGYYCGLVDAKISDVYDHLPGFFHSFDLLVTRLDSSVSLKDIRKWVEYIAHSGWQYQILGDAVWISSNYVDRVFHEQKTFFGFDEVYLLRGVPKNTPPGEHFTSDGYDFSKEVPARFIECMTHVGAVRYLSDGCGLNFACESQELADKLASLSTRT